jgi:tetratricopeptide (TPR) repeat protein
MSPTARPDVYTTLGRAYAALGKPQQAVELFEDCLAEVTEKQPNDVAAQVRFAVYLSHALSDVGEFERAGAVLRDALDRTEEFEDPMVRVRLYRSLGRLAALEGRQAAALDYVRRAIALLEATEDTLHLARAHLGCAWTLISIDRPEEALPHLESAERLFGSNPDPLDRAYLRTEQARYSARTGNGARAIQYAEEALALLGEADPGEQGSAWWALAEGLALQGSNERANDAFQLATELLEHHGQRRAAADALRAWAKLLRRMGREPEAGYAEARAEAIAMELVSARAT